MAALPKTFRALKHRNLQLFFAGQFISLIGTWMQTVAQAWLVYRLTHSALQLGLVGFLGQIPVLFISPLGGALADRKNRHKIIIATQTASMLLAFILAWLTLAHRVTIPEIYILAALLGIVSAFDIPGRQAFVVDMVGKEDLVNAIALNSSIFQSGRIIGPAIAGILVSLLGEGWCFFANGISYIAVIIGLLLMKGMKTLRVYSSGSVFQNIAEGFNYAVAQKPIRYILLLLGILSFAGMPYTVLMPIFADQILHGGASGLGLLMGAIGVGALFGALSVASKTGIRGLGRWVTFSAAGFGISLILFSISRNFWISILCLLPAGYTMLMGMASSNTLIQSLVSDRFRGRVMAVYSMMLMGMAPLGSLMAGTISHQWGAPFAVALGGGLCILGALVFGLKLPHLRIAARAMILAQETEAGAPPAI